MDYRWILMDIDYRCEILLNFSNLFFEIGSNVATKYAHEILKGCTFPLQSYGLRVDFDGYCLQVQISSLSRMNVCPKNEGKIAPTNSCSHVSSGKVQKQQQVVAIKLCIITPQPLCLCKHMQNCNS